ncbi:MAG: peptide chain release factor 2 [Spirochaetia bacterium]|nr:peptide chain release factor 2 [Spirochaetia bacterium]MBO7094360.1 peptide chain release factor 2 [Spirochaetia bacterium]MBP5739937.1 peptide chain release factor 2 [Spirochaetia bacterium]
MLEDYKLELSQLKDEILETWGIFDSERIEKEIADLEAKTAAEGFWNNREEAERVMGEIKRKKDLINPWKELKGLLDDTVDLYDLAVAEKDESFEADIASTIEKMKNEYSRLRTLALFSEETDGCNAFVTIHAGAGGTEACDWASMLYRMYTRWAERHNFKIEIADLLEAEGGIKSVTIQVEGDYAYGYLKCESGIHRLVRISPFDANARRHTSFVSVYVSPVIDDSIEIDIKPEDIRIDTYRSSGAGGQHVNKTDSAVRITHFETGIVVQCQNERSQIKNRAMAMKVLRSRLYEYYKAKQEEEKEKNAQEKKEMAWGSQIRSYVFQPYTMVKDHRTKAEVGNIQSVMDGNIDYFIEEYLKLLWQNKENS